MRRTELLQRYGDGMEFVIEDMETYAHEARLPGEHLVLFMLATYGDGEPTDNSLEFYNWVTAAAKEADGGVGNDQMLKVRTSMLSGHLGVSRRFGSAGASCGECILRLASPTFKLAGCTQWLRTFLCPVCIPCWPLAFG